MPVTCPIHARYPTVTGEWDEAVREESVAPKSLNAFKSFSPTTGAALRRCGLTGEQNEEEGALPPGKRCSCSLPRWSHDGDTTATQRLHDGYTTIPGGCSCSLPRLSNDGYTTVTQRLQVGAAARCRAGDASCTGPRPLEPAGEDAQGAVPGAAATRSQGDVGRREHARADRDVVPPGLCDHGRRRF